MQKGKIWEEIHDWGVSNARNFYLTVQPFCLCDRFIQLLSQYRIKFNYVSYFNYFFILIIYLIMYYINVCCYNTIASTIGEIKLKASYPVQQQPINISGDRKTNVAYVGPLMGQISMIVTDFQISNFTIDENFLLYFYFNSLNIIFLKLSIPVLQY